LGIIDVSNLYFFKAWNIVATITAQNLTNIGRVLGRLEVG